MTRERVHCTCALRRPLPLASHWRDAAVASLLAHCGAFLTRYVRPSTRSRALAGHRAATSCLGVHSISGFSLRRADSLESGMERPPLSETCKLSFEGLSIGWRREVLLTLTQSLPREPSKVTMIRHGDGRSVLFGPSSSRPEPSGWSLCDNSTTLPWWPSLGAVERSLESSQSAKKSY